jgi:hypothetical protein
MSIEEDRWEQPLDLAELGELTAQWLEGKMWAPWNGGSPPDPETARLVPYLAAMNRHGYATDFSQPGEADSFGSQRASVDGLCDRDCAERLASLSLATELVVITHYPGVDAVYEIPVTQSEGRTFTIAAGRLSTSELWDGMHPQTLERLAAAYYVTVLDPQWGRDDLMWSAVVAALQWPDPACGLIEVQ